MFIYRIYPSEYILYIGLCFSPPNSANLSKNNIAIYTIYIYLQILRTCRIVQSIEIRQKYINYGVAEMLRENIVPGFPYSTGSTCQKIEWDILFPQILDKTHFDVRILQLSMTKKDRQKNIPIFCRYIYYIGNFAIITVDRGKRFR